MQNFPQLLRQTHDAFTCLSRSRNWRKCVSLRCNSRLAQFPKVHEFFRKKAGEDRLCFRFLGDTATSVPQLVHSGNLDFLVFDYLSEITMSLLTAAKTKTPQSGLRSRLRPRRPRSVHQRHPEERSDPLSCAEAIQEVIRKAGLNLKVAVVTGDDLMPHGPPIKRCLDLGADIVVTGRCVDSAVTLAPLMHTFGWESSVDGGAVKVTGAKGSAPSQEYKVCATYLDGFRATAVCPVGGPRAAEKARRTAESIIKRTRGMLQQLKMEDFSSVNIQILGAEDTYGPHAQSKGCREAVIWMAVHHKQKKALEVFAREVAPAGTGMALLS
ncbi:hypothetical protein F7725_005012 [Dissostichus mawsoni]|uniref:Acyclic terpene utilisation N-terminal domain-containing protein n=1 Tax=Dissostichus mawsoni TaxID=36200 RepID=A0A7J5XN28_DISMA|nr:hypothetical protein F7725_005012 [Dissostichus mawsoni]